MEAVSLKDFLYKGHILGRVWAVPCVFRPLHWACPGTQVPPEVPGLGGSEREAQLAWGQKASLYNICLMEGKAGE